MGRKADAISVREGARVAKGSGLLTGERGRALLASDGLLPVMMVLDRAGEGAARDLRALIDAFEEVCRQRAGLSPQVLIRFWVPKMAAFLQAAEHWVQD